MLAILAPGQGAQTPGFLTPWMERPAFAARMEWFATVCGLDLIAFGTKGDAEQIRDTAVAQPLLVAAGLAAATELGLGSDAASELPAAEPPAAELVFAGHSVGELTAAALAGVLSPEQAMVLVAERGRAMAAASATTPTGMTAVLGGDREVVLATIAEHGLTAANDNGSGQVVAAGTMEQLAAFAADPPEKARLVPLSVAGAFHTHHMAPAVDHLTGLAASITPGEPTAKLLSNADGVVVDSGKVFLARLVSQVSNPVRWDLCSATLLDLGVTGMIELLPGGTLTGLAKRAMRGVTGVPLRTPEDLAGAHALLTRGASS
ncbi:MAG TPA: ACP S-malonyltransferase [Sporichthyaceae bacterium]|nr:ACP S-malonyltransferase [Sporichthyaceae bacterium]